MPDKKGTQSGGLMSEAGLVQYYDEISEDAVLFTKEQAFIAILGIGVLMISLHTLL